MRTAQEHSPAKEKLLEAATHLMLTKGFPATSLEEICNSAGLTKGSFFHYFENKEHLGKSVLDRYVAFMQQKIQQAPFCKKKDPLQRVYGYLDFVIELSKDPNFQNNCLLGTFSQELSSTHPQIRKLCSQYFHQWTETLKKDLDETKEKYFPKKKFNNKELAEHFIAILEGSFILGKATQDSFIVEKNVKHFKQYLKVLFKR
ncbi:MAG TPA: TetR/AcrR family transcriptional regulator [Nitrospiria bacterium]|jgi:TetR/AcrR family transcriptional repressor of nem operon